MSLLRNSAWAGAAAITLAVSRFVLAAILARTLTQDVFGQYAYGQWLVDLSFLLCSFGVTSAASRYVAEYRHSPPLQSAFLRRWQPFSIGLPILAAGGVLVGACLSGIKLTPIGLAMLAAWTLTNGFWAMQTAVLIGIQRFDLIFRANIVAALVMLAGAILLPLGKDPVRIFGLMALACLSGSTIGLVATNLLTRNRDRDQAEETVDWWSVKRYSANMWFATIVASLVWSRGEFPVVNSLLGNSAVAHYAAALAIFGAAVQAIMLGVGGVAPHLTSLWGQGKKKEAIVLGRTIMDVQLVLSGAGALVAIYFGPEMISLAFSVAYREAAGPLSILCLGLLSFAVSSQSYLLQLETNATFNRNSIILGLAFLYGSAILLIPEYGLIGAAVSRIAALLSIGIVTIWVAARRLGRDAVSYGNSVLVFGILLVALISQEFLSVSSIAEKVLFFIGGIFLLGILIRDTNGHIVVFRILRCLTERFA